ncbi:MAG: aminoacyl-tRNA hydrolase [Candidatus Saccharimonas sp.]
MKLVIGLGNPEPQFDSTRHNIGFWCLDTYVVAHDLKWKRSDKFHAYITELTAKSEKIILAKPTTFYNLVGESGRAIADFYKIELADVLIIHDDLALPLGTIRTRLGGSDGGNNGLKSLNTHLGLGTYRIRVGVWTEQHSQTDKVSVVLGKLSRDEQDTMIKQSPKINQLIDDFISGQFVATTHRSDTTE